MEKKVFIRKMYYSVLVILIVKQHLILKKQRGKK